eukprot:1157023-Rhodomonas_salina.2
MTPPKASSIRYLSTGHRYRTPRSRGVGQQAAYAISVPQRTASSLRSASTAQRAPYSSGHCLGTQPHVWCIGQTAQTEILGPVVKRGVRPVDSVPHYAPLVAPYPRQYRASHSTALAPYAALVPHSASGRHSDMRCQNRYAVREYRQYSASHSTAASYASSIFDTGHRIGLA